jgi:hypothetical protein
MWKLRSQFTVRQFDETTGKPHTEGPLEWNTLTVDTQKEAEEWWNCRTATNCKVNRVSTMFDPEGNVVKVVFN